MASKLAKIILAFAVVMAVMMAGCSEDGGKPQKLQKEQQLEQRQEQQQVEKNSVGLENESKDSVLGNNVKKNKVLLGGPEPRTHGCLDGCRGLPCEEKARCAQRNCPNGKFKCELKNLGTTDKDKKMDSLIEERVRDAMAKEPFKAMVEEQKKFNDSLDLRKDRNTPHKPGPEGVLRKLIRDCIEKGTCTDE